MLTYKGARELFETLLRFKGRQFTINELSKTAKLPFTTTWKLLKKFEMANVVQTKLIGKSRIIEYKEGEFSNLLKEILKISKSQQKLSLKEIKRILKKKKQIKQAYLFGSVAIGEETLESDIDIAMLRTKSFDLHPLLSEMHDKYGVNIIPLTFEDKDEFEDFLKDKKKVRLI